MFFSFKSRSFHTVGAGIAHGCLCYVGHFWERY